MAVRIVGSEGLAAARGARVWDSVVWRMCRWESEKLGRLAGGGRTDLVEAVGAGAGGSEVKRDARMAESWGVRIGMAVVVGGGRGWWLVLSDVQVCESCIAGVLMMFPGLKIRQLLSSKQFRLLDDRQGSLYVNRI